MDLTTIFSEVLHMSFMGTIVAVMIIVAKALFIDKISAKWHHYIWFLLIFRLIIPFTPESSLSIFNILPPQGENVSVQEINGSNKIQNMLNANGNEIVYPKKVSEPSELKKPSVEGNNIMNLQKEKFTLNTEIMAIMWFVGVILITLHTVAVNIRFYLKVNKQRCFDDEETIKILEACKSKMNLKVKVPIIIDSNLKTPSLYGFFKPKLLLPVETINHLSGDNKRYIFLHELSHLKRRDILINWIMMFVLILHWFNPVIWYAFHRIKEDCEVACDEYVLKHLSKEEHLKYGESIINLIKMISKPNLNPAILGLVNHKSGLKRRVQMIRSFKKISLKWSIIALVLFTSIGVTGLTSAKVTANNEDSKENQYKAKEIIIQQNEKVDLGDFWFELKKIEYMPTPTYVSHLQDDLVEITGRLTNVKGINEPFQPTGEFYGLGVSGNKYRFKFIGGDLKSYHDMMYKLYKTNKIEEIIPLGVYNFGTNAATDKDDRLTHIIYKNGNNEKILSLQEIKPIINKRATSRNETAPFDINQMNKKINREAIEKQNGEIKMMEVMQYRDYLNMTGDSPTKDPYPDKWQYVWVVQIYYPDGYKTDKDGFITNALVTSIYDAETGEFYKSIFKSLQD